MKRILLGITVCFLVSCAELDTNVKDVIGAAQSSFPIVPGPGTNSGTLAPTSVESVLATKEALEKGVGYGINLLSKSGGFTDSIHHIVIPSELQKASNLARNVGLGSYVDGFETSLNKAAEQAVSSSVPIFKDAIRNMTFTDVVTILRGPEDAATRYFKSASEKKLVETFRPIVAKATAQNNVGSIYMQLSTAVRPAALAAGVPVPAVNLDEYVSTKAVDALFVEIANQEKKIRENPLEQSTALLKKVFSYYGKKSS
ncbi:MAG: DUF4197 domain-containing protein [Chitinophagaceae bacterium]|nr:DUF4197 domain-containing protein [Oligoflexus sp.]